MLSLPDVTLCCIDTRSVRQALFALRQCMEHAQFGHALLLTHAQGAAEAGTLPGLDCRVIPPLTGIRDYNRIVLRGLLPHVRTSHVLIVQWDGFITTPSFWRDEYLRVDYIGPPWYHGGHPGLVGNGGFSLRSRRLLEVAQLLDLTDEVPEDMTLCVHRRHELEADHGIRFAPLELAQVFGCEYGGYRPSFGFHGMHNFAHVMEQPTLDRWLTEAPGDILRHQHTRKLIKELFQHGREAQALSLIRRRSELTGWTADQINLTVRAALHRLKRH